MRSYTPAYAKPLVVSQASLFLGNNLSNFFEATSKRTNVSLRQTVRSPLNNVPSLILLKFYYLFCVIVSVSCWHRKMVPNDLVALSGFGFRNLLRNSAFRVATTAWAGDTKNHAKTLVICSVFCLSCCISLLYTNR